MLIPASPRSLAARMRRERRRPAVPCPSCGHDLRSGSRLAIADPPRIARRCAGCGNAVWSSFSRVIWQPRRFIRFSTSVITMLIAISILILIGVVVSAVDPPPESVSVFVVLASYAIFGGFAGLLLRIFIPTAGRIALAVLTVASIAGAILFEGWFLLVITNEDFRYIRAPEIPRGWLIVETIWNVTLVPLLPTVTGLIFGVLLHDSIGFGIRARMRRRTSLEAT
jgi:endogenous inhibitor of DNA gyrase (YacG/DUF329 family)